MIEILVKFNTQADVVGLFNALTKYDNTIDVRYGTYLVDGKSILGLMSIGLSQVCTVIIHDNGSHPATEVLEAITPWKI